MEDNNTQWARPMMSFGEAISTCFNKYATFTGRARRSEYWFFVLFTFLVSLPFSTANTVFSISGTGGGIQTVFSVLSTMIALVFFIPSMAVSVRRLHDIGKSGWWYFAVCFAYIPFIILLVLLAFIGLMSGPSVDNMNLGMSFGVAFAVILIIFVLLCLAILGYCIFLIVLYCTDSRRETNKYGPSPKYSIEGVIFDDTIREQQN